MRIRTIVAALVVAAPLLALESPQAAAFGCWTTGHGYTATTAATPVVPRRRYGYTVATDMALALVALGLAA